MNYALLLTFLVVLAGCSSEARESDAFGNFEADETTISAEASGTLLRFVVEEGRELAAGEMVALIDTTQLALQRASLRAQRRAAQSRIEGVRAQIDVLAEKRAIAQREKDRFETLVNQDAAPTKQVDDIIDQIRVLEREMAAIRTQAGTIERELEAFDAQLAQISDRVGRHVVVNPIGGTVLESFAEPHELASPGRPLYTIAGLDTLILKAYISGRQLSRIHLGGDVTVIVDGPDGELRELRGTVSWIASEAEFTPRLIQTREERVDLVYAMKVRVPNQNGLLKIGMPAEVRFGTAEEV